MINIAVIGCGYWGPNYIRIFSGLPSATVSHCCDIDTAKLSSIKSIYPTVATTTRYQDILENAKIDAVCISTPASTHYTIGREALLNGKHVLIEKPLALSSEDAQALVRLARKEDRILMVGHVYLYHPAVQKIKSYFSEGQFDDLYYLYSARTGLGPVRRDTNAMWDLAPHDLSIYLYLLGEMPKNVSANGACHLQDGIEDMVLLAIEFPRKVMGYIHASWLDPYKSRRLTIVGKSKMLLFEDTNPTEKIKIFDQKEVEQEARTYGEFLLQERSGDIHIPKIESAEPLRNECMQFIQCIEENADPITNGEEGLQIVKILEAAEKSLKSSGVPVAVE